MDFDLFFILLLFVLQMWTHDKQCEAWNNEFQCDGYHMHAIKMSF